MCGIAGLVDWSGRLGRDRIAAIAKAMADAMPYRGPDDLADKIRYYLKHEAEREDIRRRGHARCMRDHTWHRRFENAFRERGL